MSHDNKKDREEKWAGPIPEFLGKAGSSPWHDPHGIHTPYLCLSEEVASTSRKGRLMQPYSFSMLGLFIGTGLFPTERATQT